MPTSLHATIIETPIGAMVAVAADQGLVMLEFSEPQRLQRQRASLRRQFGSEPAEGPHPYLSGIADELRAYFAGELQAFATPLHYPGTAFQVRVWDALRTLAYGDTCSYEALAAALGDAAATRAVGTANGANRLAIVIPCHRVLNKSGALGGYGGGLWRKQRLLELESRSAFRLR